MTGRHFLRCRHDRERQRRAVPAQSIYREARRPRRPIRIIDRPMEALRAADTARTANRVAACMERTPIEDLPIEVRFRPPLSIRFVRLNLRTTERFRGRQAVLPWHIGPRRNHPGSHCQMRDEDASNAEHERNEGGRILRRQFVGQRAAIESLLSWIAAAAEKLALPEAGRPLTIADYGSSEGSNALQAMHQAITALRHRGSATRSRSRPCSAIWRPTILINCLPIWLPTRRCQGRGRWCVHRGGWGLVLRSAATAGHRAFGNVVQFGAVARSLAHRTARRVCRIPGAAPHRDDVRVPAATAQAFAQLAKANLEQFLRAGLPSSPQAAACSWASLEATRLIARDKVCTTCCMMPASI